MAPLLNCACEQHGECCQCILAAHLGTKAASCSGMVVASCQYCHPGLQLAVELPQGLLVA